MKQITVLLHSYIQEVRRTMGVELNTAVAVVQSLTCEILSQQICPTGNTWLIDYMGDHPAKGVMVMNVSIGLGMHLERYPELRGRLGRISPDDYVFNLKGAALCVQQS